VQDTRAPLLNAIYEQVSRGTAGYDDFVGGSDISYGHNIEGQVTTDGSIRYPDLAHDEIPEGYRLRLENMYFQFVDSQDRLREQLKLSRVHQQELNAEILAAEHERERLVFTLEESDRKRRGAKARYAEAEVIVSKLRADLTAAMDRLDRQAEVASSKDHIIQSATEESQVAHVKLKYTEDKIMHLNAKLQRERDRRRRKTKELLDEQVRFQDLHESEIRRVEQEALDEQVRVQDHHESEIRRLRQEALDEKVRVQGRHESEVHRLEQEALDEKVRVQGCHESEIHRLEQDALDEQARVQDRHESEIRCLKQEALDEQVRVQDHHESEIRRLRQEALDEKVRVQGRHESEVHRLEQDALDEQARVQDRHESEIRCLKQEVLDEQVRVQDHHESEIHRLEQEALDEQVRAQDRHESEIRHLEQALDEQVRVQDLRESKIRRLGQEALDEQVKVQGRHESEIRRLGQEALDAQEQLDTLRGTISQQQESHHLQDELAATKGRLSLAEKELLTVRSDLEQRESRLQDGLEATKKQLCSAKEEVLTMGRNMEQQKSHLQDELAATEGQLSVAKEEVLILRHDLDQSRERLREVKTHIVFLQSEWEMRTLREAQDARRSSMTELAEVIEHLRVSQAESEESQFRCSQVTFLCASLRQRVTELEANVEKLTCPAITPVHADSESPSRSCCITGTGTGMCAHSIYAVLLAHTVYIFKNHPMLKESHTSSSCRIQTPYT